MENRFGYEQVCSVGTYTTMKPKGLIKDLARIFSIDYTEANIVTSFFSDKDTTMLDVYKKASEEKKLKSFIKNNTDIFHMMPTLLNQVKTKSIHACAMIVFPRVMKAVEWSPMRSQNGLLVSEWGGGEMDDAGFLKNDILGIKQLDKFTDILKLIKKNGKEVPDIYNLPFDKEVFRYFGNGWNGDVFQMGSSGLTEYSKALKPRSIDDLIATVALYRPGPMQNNYHNIYAKCKNEGRAPEYLWGTEDITKDTYGLLIYQEQIMQVFQDLGGLTMKEADDVRRAMGKKKLSILLPWKDRVKKGFMKAGCDPASFEEIWEVMMEFSKYSFNKSHSAAYALTGYICQYLKVNFPIEYWTVSLEYSDEKKMLSFLSEIMQADKIKVEVVDINGSGIGMISDQETNTIFWGIGSIKGIGEDTAEQIVKERCDNGDYRSFADFYDRCVYRGSKVKKTTIEALIASGAFDNLYKLGDEPKRRNFLISRYRKFAKKKIANPDRDPYTIGEVNSDWWWQKQQKLLTGLSSIDYEYISTSSGIVSQYCETREINLRQDREIFRAFGGYVVEMKVGRSKRGKYARLTIENNYKLYKVLIWSAEYNNFEEILKGCEKKLVVFDASIKYDEIYSRANQFTLRENSSLKVF